jgi:hypothetical protein
MSRILNGWQKHQSVTNTTVYSVHIMSPMADIHIYSFGVKFNAYHFSHSIGYQLGASEYCSSFVEEMHHIGWVMGFVRQIIINCIYR